MRLSGRCGKSSIAVGSFMYTSTVVYGFCIHSEEPSPSVEGFQKRGIDGRGWASIREWTKLAL